MALDFLASEFLGTEVGTISFDKGYNHLEIQNGFIIGIAENSFENPEYFIGYGCGVFNQLYIRKASKMLTLQDTIDYFCPEQPKNLKELKGMLENRFNREFGKNRDEEIRRVLANSLRLIGGVL